MGQGSGEALVLMCIVCISNENFFLLNRHDGISFFLPCSVRFIGFCVYGLKVIKLLVRLTHQNFPFFVN